MTLSAFSLQQSLFYLYQLIRQVDQTIVRINSQHMVTKQSVTDMVSEWLVPLSLREAAEWSISAGPQPLAKSWTIAFHGEPGLAARRVKKALQPLRKPDGSYAELSAARPDFKREHEDVRWS